MADFWVRQLFRAVERRQIKKTEKESTVVKVCDERAIDNENPVLVRSYSYRQSIPQIAVNSSNHC